LQHKGLGQKPYPFFISRTAIPDTFLTQEGIRAYVALGIVVDQQPPGGILQNDRVAETIPALPPVRVLPL
jgi:hypothetical protein